MTIQTLSDYSDNYGLVIRGGFHVTETDNVPDINNQTPKSLVLFGNTGSSIWDSFSRSAEYLDGEQDPMNRWSERIGNTMAKEFDGLALFPFGEPFRPFLDWAKRSESLNASKLGMIIHPDYGLWHAYRFAIAMTEKISGLADDVSAEDICSRCVNQPCLNTCPVGVFTEGRYDVENCYRYLAEEGQNTCMKNGCQARSACPEGLQFRYQTDHARFHMDKFFLSVSRRFGDSE